MLGRLLGLSFTILVASTTLPAVAAGDDAAPWLRRAAAISLPTYDKKVSSVVLVDESTMTVAEDGRVVTLVSYAIRVLNQDGKRDAVASFSYETDTGKVREFKAWLIRPSGSTKSYGKDQIIDESNLNDVYNESRTKTINARDDAEPGSVFGYQYTIERRPFFNHVMWYFQGSEPVVSSRLTLQLPSGWRANSITFNHPKVEPVVNGTSYTWELRNLPPIETEPAGPSMVNLVARLAVNYSALEGARASDSRAFESWNEVSRWYTALSDPQATPTEQVAAKARELAANAKTDLDKIRAIARFVQNIQYISIQIGVGRYRPHSAAEVLAKAYGDCKDKANLMRSMLKVLGIESYPVLIFAGDPNYVQEILPSPLQFNHCIIAIRVSEDISLPGVLTHANLGKLLIFDATDDRTMAGDLPYHEQGSLALIAAGDSGGLVRMPVIGPEANRMERHAEVELSADGSIAAKVRERSNGQAAMFERSAFRGLSSTEYKQMIERWVTTGVPAAKVLKIEPADDAESSRFGLDVHFSANHYGQVMRDQLLIFKPAIVSRRERLLLTGAARQHPVVLPSESFSETVRVTLPLGFDVDELPDPVKLDVPFGSYKTTYEIKDRELVFTRTLAQKATTIPADQYHTVRTFFEKIRAAEQAPVVLARK